MREILELKPTSNDSKTDHDNRASTFRSFFDGNSEFFDEAVDILKDWFQSETKSEISFGDVLSALDDRHPDYERLVVASAIGEAAADHVADVDSGALYDFDFDVDVSDFDFEGLAVYTDDEFILTQDDPEIPHAAATYRIYDEDGTVIAKWNSIEDADQMSTSQFLSSGTYKMFLREIGKKKGTWKAPEPSSLPREVPGYPYSNNNYPYNNYPYNNYTYTPPAPKTGYLEKYNNSDTLVFHLNDPSTAMLRQLYEGRGFDVITDNHIDPDEIHQLIKSHKNIICLGHGTASGLIGGNVGPAEAPYLRDKNLFVIWCNADKFFERYCPEAKGKFITTNLPSEVWECRAAGCGNISTELMLENITYWSKLCAEAVPMCLAGNVHDGVAHIRKHYLEKYGNHPVTIFNALGSQALGEKEPLPEYTFKGKPLAPKDYPYPNFNEEEFLKNPVPYV